MIEKKIIFYLTIFDKSIIHINFSRVYNFDEVYFMDNFKLYKKTAEYFKALSHYTRIQIIELLEDGDLCVCEIMAKLNLDQSHVSRHLMVLRNNGIVSDSRDGNKIYYSLIDKTALDVINKIKKSNLVNI